MNKRLLLIILLIVTTTISYGQSSISAKIDKVIIYPHSATIVKSVKLSLHRGENHFIIPNNSIFFNKEDLHFGLNGDCFITNSQTSIVSQDISLWAKEHLKADTYTKYIALCNKLFEANTLLEKNKYLLSIYNQQLLLLSFNNHNKNSLSFDTIMSIKDKFDYQAQRGTFLKEEILKLEKDIKTSELYVLSLQSSVDSIIKLNNNNNLLPSQTQQIALTIFSNKTQKINLNYSYNVSNVESIFKYDIFFDQVNNKANFILKAFVKQNTFESWQGTEIVFSTKENQYTSCNDYLPVKYLLSQKVTPRAKTREYSANTMLLKSTSDRQDESYDSYYPQEKDLILSRQYTVNKNITIPYGQGYQTIVLHQDTTQAVFKHKTRAKYDTKATYMAYLPQGQELNLLPVEADLFLNQNYVAKTSLQTKIQDTLTICLSEDDRVLVSRQVKRSTPDKSLFSNILDQQITITISVQNTKSTPINISIKDQVPISQDSEIKVYDIDPDGGKIDSTTGLIEWNIDMAPMEKKTIVFDYSVKYPKAAELYLD